MAHHAHEEEVAVLPPNKEKIKQLFEFVIAFMMPHGTLKTSIFVMMTIIKAGYIVGEFMHLRYEVKVLFWSVMIPITFIVWMLVAFVYEGMKSSEINFLNF
jgi:cytochrome c oxidase subunit IV